MRYLPLQIVLGLVLISHATLAQNPISAHDYSQRGIARFEKNDLEGAVVDFTKAIEMNGPQLEFCYYFRGIALYRLGKFDEALADLGKAITLKQHPRFYDDRGNLLAQKGDFDGALADLNKAIELESKYAKAYGDRAIVHLMRGEDAAAELDFKKCFELDKTLETQVKAAANRIRQLAIVRAKHNKPGDVEIIKFNWQETPSQVAVASEPSIPITTTAVSQSGLRVLGGSGEKGDPGPAPVREASSRRYPGMNQPRTVATGVNYKFTVLIKNSGGKTIAGVQWAYFFFPKDSADPLAYVITNRTNLPPGKEKTLSEQVPSTHIHVGQGKGPTLHNRALFEERVVILRLDYADGTTWQSRSPISNAPNASP